MVLIAIAGDVHGDISILYGKVLELQKELNAPIEMIFQVGDMHLYSDASPIDSAVASHGGPGEFPAWFNEKKLSLFQHMQFWAIMMIPNFSINMSGRRSCLRYICSRKE